MRKFELKIHPRMLELLSRDLYTNIYSVFAELIANAYDADADNVYLIISEDEIVIEDDGCGMSFDEINNVFLMIGLETRPDEKRERTEKNRLKMGRKGVGKLSALAISDGFYIYSRKNNQKTGLFFPKSINTSGEEKLPEISENDIKFKYIKGNGTAIIMKNPNIKLPVSFSTIYRNLALMFPFTGDDFKIHIKYKNKFEYIKNVSKISMSKLATLITIGKKYSDYKKYSPKVESEFYLHKSFLSKEIILMTKKGEKKNFNLKIEGWIGTMKSTKESKKDLEEFSDNYIAIYSHNKLGSRNILQIIGKNRVYESYIVSQLHIDLFENSELKDMASTNRQNYRESDERWIQAKQMIRELTDEVVRLHGKMASKTKKNKEKDKINKLKKNEEELRVKINSYRNKITSAVEKGYREGMSKSEIVKLVDNKVNVNQKIIGIKNRLDSMKKKIMISQTLKDKYIADIVLKMLTFNNVNKNEIIHSNSEFPECNLPENDIYDYLKSFFVDSYSKSDIYIFFVTSKNVYNVTPPEEFAAKWGVLMEMGAAWVTREDYSIINILNFVPQMPLNIKDKWVDIKFDNETKIAYLTEASINSFCKKIRNACKIIGTTPKTFEENKAHLKSLVEVYVP